MNQSPPFDIRLSSQATHDIQEIEAWYEETGVEGLALQFLDVLQQVVNQIRQFPLSHPIWKNSSFRKASVSPFPYSIYYEVDTLEKAINILVIIHQARDEAFVKSRISQV